MECGSASGAGNRAVSTCPVRLISMWSNGSPAKLRETIQLDDRGRFIVWRLARN